MKIKTLAAVVISAILIAGVLLSLNYGLAAKLHVEIISFNSTGTSSGSNLGVVKVWFTLNLTNTGTGRVENLTVTFSTNRTIGSNKQLIYANFTAPDDHIAEFEIGQPYLLGVLKAAETKDYMFYWPISLDFDVPPLTATIKSNQATLDQKTTTIPPLFNVKITNFICLGVWHGTTLGPMLDLFSLSYSNLGITNVENLTVTLNTSKTNPTPRATPNPQYHPYRLLDESINGETYQLEPLNAKQTKTFEKTYFLNMGFLLVEPFTLTATLKSNNTILDQATIQIPIKDSHIDTVQEEYIG